MEVSHVAEDNVHEAIDKSMQTALALPSFDSHFCSQDKNTIQEVEEPGPPHEALFLVLAYLPLFELLAMSEVCISLKDAVNKDILPWLDVIVERPLNLLLSDEILMKITSKANGRLRTLVLMNCVKITDYGLQRVIEKNPLISKLYIPACTGLTPEGVIRAVKTLSKHHQNLKSIRINGIYNTKKQHLQTLHSHLKLNLAQKDQQRKQPILYYEYRNFPTFRYEENDRIIDIGICPLCNEVVSMVFDCPRETCKRKITECTGCISCIPRCEECGVCVQTELLGEAVCTDTLCLDCWLKLPKCNFCNKPYCKRHAHQQCSSPGSVGWVCQVCHANFTECSCNDVY